MRRVAHSSRKMDDAVTLAHCSSSTTFSLGQSWVTRGSTSCGCAAARRFSRSVDVQPARVPSAPRKFTKKSSVQIGYLGDKSGQGCGGCRETESPGIREPMSFFERSRETGGRGTATVRVVPMWRAMTQLLRTSRSSPRIFVRGVPSFHTRTLAVVRFAHLTSRVSTSLLQDAGSWQLADVPCGTCLTMNCIGESGQSSDPAVGSAHEARRVSPRATGTQCE
jgi:hypothetical protein